MKNNKSSLLNSLYLSFFISTLGYILALAVTGPYLISSHQKEFNLLTKSIENYKQKAVLMGLLVESELHSHQAKTAEQISAEINFVLHDGIYAVDDSPLTQDEAVARKVMHQTINHLTDFVNNEEVMLLYRSYVGKKYITQHRVQGFQATESLFAEEKRCQITMLCTRYAWPEQLSDRLVISPIYQDAITLRPVISIASPIYGVKDSIKREDIVGEFIVDIYLDNQWIKERGISSYSDGLYKYIQIDYGDYWFKEIAFSNTYIGDNKTAFIYSYPASKLLIQYVPVFLLLLVITTSLSFMHKLSRLLKKQLDTAINLATVDELTGLLNRKVFNSASFRHASEGKTLSIVAIDGNKIKYINDKYGHHIGDQAIKHIADMMSKVFRKSDFLIRTGGDEFLAILPNCSLEQAEKLVHKLKEQIESHSFSSMNLKLSVSCGIHVKQAKQSVEEAIIDADKKLYQHKTAFHTGKNTT